MKHNIFGTDGIRGSVGFGILTLENIPTIGYAIGQWIHTTFGPQTSILIAHDTRASSDWFIAALQSGLLLNPITIHNAGVLPTPAVSALLHKHPYLQVGIIISASHNPAHDNGIKLVINNGTKLSQKQEEDISDLYLNAQPCTYQAFGARYEYPQAAQEYINLMLDRFPHPFLTGKKIVLDCAHGATYEVAQKIFNALGATTEVINNQPNGTNINESCGALHTEKLQQHVTDMRADIGFAFDGDGDRVMPVNHNGECKNGDDIIALLMHHPIYKQEKNIIGTIMSNHGLDTYIRSYNKNFIRTDVGDKYVAEHMKKNSSLLGGEQSGHIVLNDYLQTGDGIFTALRLLEAIQHTHNWDMKTFKKYPQVLVNLSVGQKKNLQDPCIASILTKYEQELETGRLIVRYSGTENILRIMVEDTTEQQALHVGTNIAHNLKPLLQ